MKKQLSIQSIVLLFVLILLNQFATSIHWQIDFTEEKRYTLTPDTKTLLKAVDEDIEIFVFLENNQLPSSFKRLQTATKDLLFSFQKQSKYPINITFENPLANLSAEERQETIQELSMRGITPTNLRIKTKEGYSEKLLFPGALINYKGKQFPIMLISGQRGEQDINRSIELLEYKFANAISKLEFEHIPTIAFTQGNGELSNVQTQDIRNQLTFNYYKPENIVLQEEDSISQSIDMLIIAKPTKAFTETEKFKIDHYIMQGGKVIWAVDMMKMNLDSLRQQWGGRNVAVDFNLNIDDQLFSYGARIKRNFVRDMQCKPIPIVIDNNGQQQLIPWTFHPVISSKQNHIINKNIDPVGLEFVSSIDTVGNKTIKKTILLSSSEHSGLVANPVLVDLEELRNPPSSSAFALESIPIAVLLEGSFPSLYNYRSSPISTQVNRRDESNPTTMAIIADGDIFANEVLPNGQSLPLGFDRNLQQQLGNREFILNLIDYMANPNHTLQARNKQVTLRLLNQVKVDEQKQYWQRISFALPLLFACIVFLLFYISRKILYANQ